MVGIKQFFLAHKHKVILSAVLVVAWLAFLAGFAALLPVAIVATLVCLLPPITVIESYFSKAVISIFVLFGAFQLAAVLQFFLFSDSGFKTSATILTVLLIATVWITSKLTLPKKVFSKTDVGALVAASCFVVPLIILVFSGNSIARITKLGAIQGNDGATHYNLITEASEKERITYEDGSAYYPYGFHLTTAFLEESVHISQPELGWSTSVRLYIMQYIVLAGLLSMVAYFLCAQITRSIHKKTSPLTDIGVGLSLGVPLAALYLVPFLYHGFLNYFYIIGSVFCALLFLLYRTKKDSYQPIMLVSSLLLFGASASWPVLIPVGLLILALTSYLWANGKIWKLPLASLVVLGVCMMLQLLPLYLQMMYSDTSTSAGINMPGGLKVFNAAFLCAASALCAYGWFSDKIPKTYADFIKLAMTPLLLLVAALVAFQYFFVGEPRYYAIKLLMVVEVAALVLLVAFLTDRYIRVYKKSLVGLGLLIVLPAIIFMSLLALTANPFTTMRDAFRNISGQSKPAYFDSDTTLFAKLGAENKIDDFNAIALHYNAEQGKFFAHPQTSYWVHSVGFNAALDAYEEKGCHYGIYINLMVGNFTDKEQQSLATDLQSCAALAHQNGDNFFVVTDRDSLPHLQGLGIDNLTYEY